MLGRSLLMLALLAASASARAVENAADGGPPAFRLEGRPAIDDIFGDTSDYRRTIDRFLELTAAMQSMREEFAKTVQAILNELKTREAREKKRSCPVAEVAAPYARARRLGSEYLRVGRELTRHHETVKEYDRLGESIGLTPDYRWKVRRVLAQYPALLTDYREMKIALHDQLDDELKFVGCDLTQLAQKGDPKGSSAEEAWPSPGQPGAPGVLAKTEPKDPHETPPANFPVEKVSQPPIPVPP